MEQRYTMKDVIIECQLAAKGPDRKDDGTSDANISNYFSTCFCKLRLQEEWVAKKTGKAYAFTINERDILVELFQKRDIILKSSIDRLDDLRALLDKVPGLFDDEEMVRRKLDAFITRIIYEEYPDQLKSVLCSLVDSEFCNRKVLVDNDHYLRSGDLEYWVKSVMFALGLFVKQWKQVIEEMEALQKEKVYEEVCEQYRKDHEKIEDHYFAEKCDKVKKDRKYRDIRRKCERAETEEERKRTERELEQRDAELSNRAMNSAIDESPRPQGYAPWELLWKALANVHVPCYKMDCDIRLEEIKEKRLDEIKSMYDHKPSTT